jgi:hypothetical protein
MANNEKGSAGKGREFRKDLAFLVFIACLLIGIGIGIAYDQVTVGVLIGLGLWLFRFIYSTLEGRTIVN